MARLRVGSVPVCPWQAQLPEQGSLQRLWLARASHEHAASCRSLSLLPAQQSRLFCGCGADPDMRKLKSPSPALKDTEKVLEGGNRLSDESQSETCP